MHSMITDRADYDRAVDLALACYAEAGFPSKRLGSSADGVAWAAATVPHDVVLKARELIYESMGVQWR